MLLPKEDLLAIEQLDQNTLLGGRTELHYLVAIAIVNRLQSRVIVSNLSFNTVWSSSSKVVEDTINDLDKQAPLDKGYVLELTRNLYKARCMSCVSIHTMLYYVLYENPELLKEHTTPETLPLVSEGFMQLFPDLKEALTNNTPDAIAGLIRDRLADSDNRLTKLELKSVEKGMVVVIDTLFNLRQAILSVDVSFNKMAADIYALQLAPVLGLNGDEAVALLDKHKRLFTME